jgi:hypothetical protein
VYSRYLQVPCPDIIQDYNKNMGGCDLSDMLAALYRIDHKSRKWYMRIFHWVLNVAVINGWLLYRRHENQRLAGLRSCKTVNMQLCEFTASISESLVQAFKVPTAVITKRGRPMTSSQLTLEGRYTICNISKVNWDQPYFLFSLHNS